MWISTQLLNEEKEVIFESDDVAEVVNKANELYSKCESDMINRRRKNGLNCEAFIK